MGVHVSAILAEYMVKVARDLPVHLWTTDLGRLVQAEVVDMILDLQEDEEPTRSQDPGTFRKEGSVISDLTISYRTSPSPSPAIYEGKKAHP
jgi:hypothetical protein